MKLLSFYCRAVGIITVNWFYARNMGKFKYGWLSTWIKTKIGVFHES